MDFKRDRINERIFYLMKALGANQKSFALQLGVTQPAVSKYLKDRIPPPLVLLKLAKISGTSIEWILTGDRSEQTRHVAETDASYITPSRLEDKLARLPLTLQTSIIALVDSLISLPEIREN
jgi:transcriptional regulator with XRE-family HTH domain